MHYRYRVLAITIAFGAIAIRAMHPSGSSNPELNPVLIKPSDDVLKNIFSFQKIHTITDPILKARKQSLELHKTYFKTEFFLEKFLVKMSLDSHIDMLIDQYLPNDTHKPEISAQKLIVRSLLRDITRSEIKLLSGEKYDATPLDTFNWCIACPEAPLVKRINLIFDILLFVQNNFKPSDRLVYTSFGSGYLLQDVLTLSALSNLGYTNITINLIDTGYKGIKGKLLPCFSEFMAKRFGHFLPSVKCTAEQPGKVDCINIYSSVYNYISDTEKNPILKCTILAAVDLGQGSQANVPEDSPTINEIFIRIPQLAPQPVEKANSRVEHIALRQQNPNIVIVIPPIEKIRTYTNIELEPSLQKLIRESKRENFASLLKAELTKIPHMTGFDIAFLSDPWLIAQELILKTVTDNGCAFFLGVGIRETLSKKEFLSNPPISLFEEPEPYSAFYQLYLKDKKRIQ